MNQHGRVVVVGSISSYNEDQTNLPKAAILQPAILYRRLTVSGYIVWDSRERFPEAFDQIIKWIQSGKIVAKEHVTEGFDNLYDALVGVLKGDNIGKAVVKI
uniref:SFRICE_041272 n=1 Tax=Spodoptera frugiperda TaxID=7108 RepID=A0A2H1X242_SPOFR